MPRFAAFSTMRPNAARALLVGAALLTAALPLPANAAVCEILQFRFMLGADSGAYMNVRSGKDCQVKLTPGTRSFQDFEIERIEIVERPVHGSAKANGLLGTMYRSNPEFKGKDAYAFTVCGMGNNVSSCSLVRIKVHVR
jgi:hypothetical protein